MDVTEIYWLEAERKLGNYPYTRKNCGGKWLVFKKNSEINKWWRIIKKATEGGQLGNYSKVSTAKENPNAKDPNIKVICIYTYDYQDKSDVFAIREELRKLGITEMIPYKTDQATLEGKYQKDGHDVWIYKK